MLRLERIACPLCGSQDSKLLVATEDLLCGIPGRFTIDQCAKCRHVFMNPRPTLDSMSDCYPDQYGPHQTAVRNSTAEQTDIAATSPASLTSPSEQKQTSAPASAARPWYLRVLPLRHIPGLRRLYFALLNDRSQPLPSMELIRAECGDPTTQSLHAVELGCATGLYLQRLSDDGWQVTGIEPGAKPAAMARSAGFDVHCGTLDSCQLPENAFEFAAAWMVIEHVPDPRSVLQALHRLLKPGGVLHFSIPNAGCWEPRIFRSRWYAWEPPRHLHHFTPASIRRLLTECGYTEIEVTHQRNVSYVIGSLGLVLLKLRPGSRIGRWLRDYPGQPKLALQLLLAPMAHVLAWLQQGGRLTISARKPD